jgi:uncharacterized Zn finger protein
MPSWDNEWGYPASRPIKVEGGIATSRKRGAMADTWWSKRFTNVLESYGLGGRMQRGRSYARAGQVLSLDVSPGTIEARVQGSRSKPYAVTVTFPLPTDAQWLLLDDAFQSRVGFAARLLAGEVPPDLEDVFVSAGVALFPKAWRELRPHCSCPDSTNPCKHIAAVLYVYADRLDTDPWLLLAWRGRTREQLLARFASAAPTPSITTVDTSPLPPWWPLAPGRSAGVNAQLDIPDHTVPDVAAQVLSRLDVLSVTVAEQSIVELLQPAYEALAGD